MENSLENPTPSASAAKRASSWLSPARIFLLVVGSLLFVAVASFLFIQFSRPAPMQPAADIIAGDSPCSAYQAAGRHNGALQCAAKVLVRIPQSPTGLPARQEIHDFAAPSVVIVLRETLKMCDEKHPPELCSVQVFRHLVKQHPEFRGDFELAMQTLGRMKVQPKQEMPSRARPAPAPAR